MKNKFLAIALRLAYVSRVPDHRGALAIVTNAGRNAVDADGIGRG
jgi:hypothetical protein